MLGMGCPPELYNNRMLNKEPEVHQHKERQVATIYVDESGNKFDAVMLHESPFFVYAWLLLTTEQENEINLRIPQILRKEGFPKHGELRAKNMWGSVRGLRRFDQITRAIQDSGARAYVTFTEKRFEICVLICETYLDYLENDAAEFYKNFGFCRRLMNVVYQSVTDDFLNRFREACIEDNVDLLKKIGIRLANMLALHPDPDISRSARLFEEGAKAPFRFGQRCPDGPQNVHLVSSHVTLFSTSLIFFESELESLGLTARIIRDQDSVYGEVLDYTYKFLTDDIKLKNLAGCQECTSKNSIGIQLADLLAGATERVLRAKCHKRRLAQTNESLWATLRLSLVHGKWTYQLISDSCEAALESLWDYKSLPKIDSNRAIDPQNPLRCSCGEVIATGKIRDYYNHVINVHPTGTVPGLKCQMCGQLIPMWLGACHEVIEHRIEPPFRGDFYSDMHKDYEVLQAVLKAKVRIVEIPD
jgi:hypothetical protein